MIESLLCCPKCRGDLERRMIEAEHPEFAICTRCGAEYPVVGGIPDVATYEMQERGRGQRLMEAPWLVTIYESRWWRDSKLFAWLLGVSLADEIALVKRITAPGPRDTVLDLACGPGVYARSFARDAAGRKVIGVDLSWPMLLRGAETARQQGLGNLVFVHGDAHGLPVNDGSVDVVTCCGALHLFSDVRRVLGELARVLRPGGRLAVATAWRRPGRLGSLRDWNERLWGMHSFATSELEDLFSAAGFTPTVYHTRGFWLIAGGVRAAEATRCLSGAPGPGEPGYPR